MLPEGLLCLSAAPEQGGIEVLVDTNIDISGLTQPFFA